MVAKYRLIINVLLVSLAISIPVLSLAESDGGTSAELTFTWDDVPAGKPADATGNTTLMDAAKAYLDASAPEDKEKALKNMHDVADRFDRDHPLPSIPAMIFSAATAFLWYILFPAMIRFVFLRRPVRTRLAAIFILLPIFILFAVGLNAQKNQAQRELCRGMGAPYKQTPHMFGSPLLYGAMAVSFYILRRRGKNMKEHGDKTSPAVGAAVQSETAPEAAAGNRIESSVRQIFSFLELCLEKMQGRLQIKKHQAVAIILGLFLLAVSCFPLLFVKYCWENYWERGLFLEVPSIIIAVFAFPVIGAGVAAILVFIAFLKE